MNVPDHPKGERVVRLPEVEWVPSDHLNLLRIVFPSPVEIPIFDVPDMPQNTRFNMGV